MARFYLLTKGSCTSAIRQAFHIYQCWSGYTTWISYEHWTKHCACGWTLKPHCLHLFSWILGAGLKRWIADLRDDLVPLMTVVKKRKESLAVNLSSLLILASKRSVISCCPISFGRTARKCFTLHLHSLSCKIPGLKSVSLGHLLHIRRRLVNILRAARTLRLGHPLLIIQSSCYNW